MKPVLVLIGGATGTGKSTVAVRVAQALGITRIAPTDVVRQTMRAFFAPELMPSLHVSSFEGAPLVDTFLEQAEAVLTGVRATFERAVEETRSTVVEGVHLVPGLVEAPAGAVVVHCTLSLATVAAHAEHLAARGERYLGRLEEIRSVHDFLVDASLEHGVPVVENRGVDATVAAILGLVPELERI
jgi:2-phosphoglycerate kinase